MKDVDYPPLRQTWRRAERIAAKRKTAREASAAGTAALEAFRAARDPYSLPEQGPGLKIPLGRPYRKSKSKPFRSVVTLTELPNGDAVPAGCEAMFHATKGLRVIRSQAA